MSVITITSVDQLTERFTPGDTVIVKLFATWCGPCKAFAPIFERASTKEAYDHRPFVEIDIEAAPDIAEYLQVQTVPALRAVRITGEGRGYEMVEQQNWPLSPKVLQEFVGRVI